MALTIISVVELREVGEIIIWVAAVATAVTVLVRLRPVRWLARTAVCKPVMGAFRREVAEVVTEVVPAAVEEALAHHPITNGWGTKAVQKNVEGVDTSVDPASAPGSSATKS